MAINLIPDWLVKTWGHLWKLCWILVWKHQGTNLFDAWICRMGDQISGLIRKFGGNQRPFKGFIFQNGKRKESLLYSDCNLGILGLLTPDSGHGFLGLEPLSCFTHVWFSQIDIATVSIDCSQIQAQTDSGFSKPIWIDTFIVLPHPYHLGINSYTQTQN